MEFFAPPDRSDPRFKSFLSEACLNLSDWFSTTNQRPPSPSFPKLPEIPPHIDGLSARELLDDLQLLMAGSYQPSHPGALAHLDPPPLTASIVAEMISAGLNNNLLAEELSPSITKLERGLCKWFAEQLLMPETSGGVAVSGGSITNLMALLVARSKYKKPYDSNLVVMASEESHVSISRALAVMGLTAGACCKISTDDDGKIEMKSLKDQYYRLRSQGKNCFAVIATAGTTIRGAVDPLLDISQFCENERLWLHVDAAIGGSFALNPSTSDLMQGLSKANSLTINPQKILGITKTSSLLLVANIEHLYSCFSTGFPYIEPSQGNYFQGGEIGLQGTRSAEVLKLWLGLRQLGKNGIKHLLEGALKRRSYFHKKIDHTKLKVITGPLHLLAVKPLKSTNNDSINWAITTKESLSNQGFMLSRPFYKGDNYLKAVMGNPHTKLTHIDALAAILNQSI